ncbi:unnamed protein product, partial [Amoebophrya sp. A25]
CAKGSGLPEVKSLLSGHRSPVPDFTTVRTLVCKTIGLICALSAGLPVGKLGPYVHIACCTAASFDCSGRVNRWVQQSCWSSTSSSASASSSSSSKLSASAQTRLYTAAVAAGVCASFGAPLGATLFAIEIATTFF